MTVLDTDTLSLFFAGQRNVGEHAANEPETEENLTKLTIIPFDDQAALIFDKLRENKKLKKIGRPDLLIASIALAQNATLVTRNVRHFQQIPGLKFKNWAG